MPVYHFTIHAYRSWRPDHPRGYTEYGEGYQPPNEHVAEIYDDNATQEPVEFDDAIQRDLLRLTYEICKDEGWRLEAIAFDPTHEHAVISWCHFIPWEEVDRRLKNLLALKMNRLHDSPGKRWFVRRHGAARRVEKRSHYDHLMNKYLADHRGLFWKRGMELPV